ncbi:MAG: magnesium transporter CorA family protein [Verrucomicrobia bacterium]|nr:magnesium transporter CorA family protein [Verrucomicrobiota bacterium]
MISTLVYRDHKLAGHNPPLESLAALRQEAGVMLWIDLSQPTPEEVTRILETLFAFHPLTIEDCVSDSPLPKLEDYGDYLYLVAHAIAYAPETRFTTTELDLFLGPNYLVTYHRLPLKAVSAVLERNLRAAQTPVRGPDRIAHGLLDALVEGCKPALAALRAEVDGVEEGVLRNISAAELFPRVVALRKDLSRLRQLVRPQREVVLELSNGKTKLIRPLLLPYLRDVGDDLVRIETQAGSWAEQLILSFRIYLNKSGYEANQGIKVITGITALTIPPLVVGGWFGMNFERMHELHAGYGYPIALALTGVSMLGMLLFMRKKRWI